MGGFGKKRGREGGVDEFGGGQGRYERRWSSNLSFCSLAREVACGRERGCRACISRRSSRLRPETKQLSSEGGDKPTMRLANLLNSSR